MLKVDDMVGKFNNLSSKLDDIGKILLKIANPDINIDIDNPSNKNIHTSPNQQRNTYHTEQLAIKYDISEVKKINNIISDKIVKLTNTFLRQTFATNRNIQELA